MGVDTIVVHARDRDSHHHWRLAVLVNTEGWGCWAGRHDCWGAAGDGGSQRRWGWWWTPFSVAAARLFPVSAWLSFTEYTNPVLEPRFGLA